MKARLLALLMTITSPATMAQTVVKEDAQKYVVSVPHGMGLGQIIRSLGKDPNWVARGWIKEIQKVNPKNIQESGEILYSNIEITIPKESLSNLKTLNTSKVAEVPATQLPQKKLIETPEPLPVMPAMIEPAKVEPVASKTYVIEEPQASSANSLAIKAPTRVRQHKAHGLKLSLLTGLEQMTAQSTTNAKVDLNSEVGYGLKASWVSDSAISARVHAKWLNIDYKKPNNTSLIHDDSNQLELGLGVQKSFGDKLNLFLDGLYKQQSYVQLTTVNQINVENLASPAARVGASTQLTRGKNWNSRLTGSFTHLSSKTSGLLKIKEGHEANIELSLVQKSGFAIDLSYTNRDQDTSITKHNSDLSTLGFSYSY